MFVKSGFVSSSVPALLFFSNVVEINTVQLILNPRLTVQIIAVFFDLITINICSIIRFQMQLLLLLDQPYPI